jgi:hypothetical protein
MEQFIAMREASIAAKKAPTVKVFTKSIAPAPKMVKAPAVKVMPKVMSKVMPKSKKGK